MSDKKKKSDNGLTDYQIRKNKIAEMKKILDECKDGGLARYDERGALEIIMRYVFNKHEYKNVTGRLLQHCGSIRDVFSAPLHELYQIEGLGRAAAEQICCIGDVFRDSNTPKPQKNSFITKDSTIEFCKELFKNYVKEAMYIIYIDNHLQFVAMNEIFRKFKSFIPFDLKDIVEDVLRFNAKNVLIAHNHPKGLITPSSRDIATTRKIVFFLRDMGVKTIDHIIISGNQYFSFRSSGYFNEVLE